MSQFGWAWVSVVGGLIVLVGGGELLVRGASRLASALRISSLVIGLTVVAFGTSAPELAVSVQAALAGNADLAMGNVVGSNIFNILFILGASALIVPLIVSSQLVRFDVPVMIISSLLALVFSWDGIISHWEGAVLFAGIVAYTWRCIRQSRSEGANAPVELTQEGQPNTHRSRAFAFDVALIVVGLCLLGLGSRLLIDGSVVIASKLGVSQLVIGLTIIAAGTSLPEVVTSIVAAFRGERDIAVGNVVGSNIFNLLSVLGLSSVIAEVKVSHAARTFDIPVMIAVAVLCLPIFLTGKRISRWEGGMLLLLYGAYTTFLVLQASGTSTLDF